MHLRRRKSTADLLLERVHEITDTVADKATDLTGKAAVALAPKVGTARVAANSAYEQASTLVREDVAPRVREAAVPAVAAAMARTQLRKEPEKKHRLRKLLFVLGLGGVAAYAAKRFGLLGGSSDSFGQTSPSGSSYAGTTSTTPERPSAVPDARDGADPLAGGDAEAAGATFADPGSDSDTELGRDLTDKLSEDETSEGTQDLGTEFPTAPPTEATPDEQQTGSKA